MVNVNGPDGAGKVNAGAASAGATGIGAASRESRIGTAIAVAASTATATGTPVPIASRRLRRRRRPAATIASTSVRSGGASDVARSTTSYTRIGPLLYLFIQIDRFGQQKLTQSSQAARGLALDGAGMAVEDLGRFFDPEPEVVPQIEHRPLFRRYGHQRRPDPQPLPRGVGRVGLGGVREGVAGRAFPAPRSAGLVDRGAVHHRLRVQVGPLQPRPPGIQAGKSVGDGIFRGMPVATRDIGERAQRRQPRPHEVAEPVLILTSHRPALPSTGIERMVADRWLHAFGKPPKVQGGKASTRSPGSPYGGDTGNCEAHRRLCTFLGTVVF